MPPPPLKRHGKCCETKHGHETPSQSPDVDDALCFSFRRTRGIRLWPSRHPRGPKKSRKRENFGFQEKISNVKFCRRRRDRGLSHRGIGKRRYQGNLSSVIIFFSGKPPTANFNSCNRNLKIVFFRFPDFQISRFFTRLRF